MAAELFTKTTRNCKNILQLKPALLTNPAANAFGTMTYEIVEGRVVQTRTGLPGLREEKPRFIEDIVGIDESQPLSPGFWGLARALWSFIFRAAQAK